MNTLCFLCTLCPKSILLPFLRSHALKENMSVSSEQNSTDYEGHTQYHKVEIDVMIWEWLITTQNSGHTKNIIPIGAFWGPHLHANVYLV